MKEKRSTEGDVFSHFVLTVMQLSGNLSEAGDILAKPSGQTSARWKVLAGAEHGNMSVAEIARRLGSTRQGIQRIADILDKEGLTSYLENPLHQRAKLLKLTEKGRKVLAEIQQRQIDWANRFGAKIGESDLRQAIQILERVMEQLKKDVE